jgi:hypothetical protein
MNDHSNFFVVFANLQFVVFYLFSVVCETLKNKICKLSYIGWMSAFEN